MEKFTDQKVEKLLKALEVKPREEWVNKMLQEIRSLPRENTRKESFLTYIQNFFNLFVMKKLAYVSIAVLIFAIGVGVFMSLPNPYAKAEGHLAKAEQALTQLKSYTEGENISDASEGFSLMPTAFAEESTDAQVVNLIKTVKIEIEAAIDASTDIDEAAVMAQVLERIDELQAEVFIVLSDVIEKSEQEEVLDAAAETLKATLYINEEVNVNIKSLKVSMNAGEKEPKVKFTFKNRMNENDDEDDDDDSSKEERNQERFNNAKNLIIELQASTSEMTPAMQEKFQTISVILKECEVDLEICKIGKANGLAVALEAKFRNEQRHGDEDEDDGSDDEEENENEDEDEDNDEDGDDRDNGRGNDRKKSVNIEMELNLDLEDEEEDEDEKDEDEEEEDEDDGDDNDNDNEEGDKDRDRDRDGGRNN